MTDFHPHPQTQTFGEWAAIAIAKHARKVFKSESDVLKDKDPEDLHQMRVGMRRLRTAVISFERAVYLPRNVSEKSIGKIAKVLGKLRDIDVLQETIETQYKPVLSLSEQKQLDQVLKALKKIRKSALKQVRATLNGDFYQTFKLELRNWIENPHYQTIADVAIDIVLADLLLPELAHFLLHPGWWVGVQLSNPSVTFQEPLDPVAIRELLDCHGIVLHDLRKAAKKIRYQMELFTQFYDEKYHNFIQDIKHVQDVLGNIQDGFVLTEFLNENLEIDVSKNMPELMARLTEIRHQQWQEWEVLQRKFIQPQTRQDLRVIVQHPYWSTVNHVSH